MVSVGAVFAGVGMILGVSLSFGWKKFVILLVMGWVMDAFGGGTGMCNYFSLPVGCVATCSISMSSVEFRSSPACFLHCLLIPLLGVAIIDPGE